MPKPLFHYVTLVALLLTTLLCLPKPSHFPQVLVKASKPVDLTGTWHLSVASDMLTTMVHAPSMIELPNGQIRAFWFAGSREGAKDVRIDMALFDPKTGHWQKESTAVTRDDVIAHWGRYVRKLGNIVPVLDDDGSLRLFVTAPSFGGWAASRIVVYRSKDNGATWQFQTELKLSPFLNISNLVKTPVLHYQDGTIGLPIYHEFIGKFGQLLRLDQDNHIVSLSRIGEGRKVLQPLVLANTSQELVSFLRPAHKGFAYQSSSQDSGKTWQPVSVSSLINPGSALGGVRLAKDHFLVVSNCAKRARDVLCVEQSQDKGKTWQPVVTFYDESAHRKDMYHYQSFVQRFSPEFAGDADVDYSRFLQHVRKKVCNKHDQCEFKVDYPYMIQASNGDIHIVYTWNKIFIRHAWLKAGAEGNPHND